MLGKAEVEAVLPASEPRSASHRTVFVHIKLDFIEIIENYVFCFQQVTENKTCSMIRLGLRIR
jgi:hypothetical protein